MPHKCVLDANLSVLLVVGSADRKGIVGHKRLSAYDENDFDILLSLLGNFDEVIVTPHSLAETSNLLGHGESAFQNRVAMILAAFIEGWIEADVRSRVAVKRSEYRRLGLTDAVLLEASKDGAVLLTADLHLYLAASAAGYEAINFNHLKDMRSDYR